MPKVPTWLKAVSPLAAMIGAGGGNKGGSQASPRQYKRGGKVRKGGVAKVHKGEKVLTKRQARRYHSKR